MALRTFSVWPEDWIEPDSSSTSMTSIPQRGGRFGFGPGVPTVTPPISSFASPSAPLQLSASLGVKVTS